MHADWKKDLTERELKEIEFCKVYAEQFAHGTTGHNAMILVAKLAKLLDEGYGQMVAVKPDYTGPIPGPIKKPGTLA